MSDQVAQDGLRAHFLAFIVNKRLGCEVKGMHQYVADNDLHSLSC